MACCVQTRFIFMMAVGPGEVQRDLLRTTFGHGSIAAKTNKELIEESYLSLYTVTWQEGSFVCVVAKRNTAVSLQQPLRAVVMEKAQVRLIKPSSNFTKAGWSPKTKWNAVLNKYIIYSCGSILVASNEDVGNLVPPVVQKSKHQSSQPRL